MRVKLLGYVENVERIIAACSKATRSKPSDELLSDLSIREARKHVGKVLARGHEGLSEFAYFIFSISGVSRVLTHQLVRHRIASYLQMSSREADLSHASFIVPPKISQNKENSRVFEETVNKARENYEKLVKAGVLLEDARYLLPDSLETHISMAIDGRSLNNFFGLRLCERAQWEIRELATQMRNQVIKISPALFWSEPRPCVRRGICPEGKKSCGFVNKKEFERERKKFLEGYPNE
jgi:thymidylate synthase (FAD)